jgi:hypothetical protein
LSCDPNSPVFIQRLTRRQQYVDKLYQHAAVTGTTQERLDAIAEFNGAATASDPGARARAVVRITQNAAFRQREGNRAFVFMEYVGYLRRSPNDPPDGNFDGYNFWLTKLNQFNGDFLQAEMVKAFLSSIEYRTAFWTMSGARPSEFLSKALRAFRY